MKRGAFTISIDLELMWGVWDNPPHRMDGVVANMERLICKRLVKMFEAYQIPVTWAIVGRLLKPLSNFENKRGPKEGWVAQDIVSLIKKSSVKHDMGSHGFEHLYFASTKREALKQDLEQAASIQQEWELSMGSFVFPRNQIAHLDLLAKSGVEVFRSTDQGMLAFADSIAPRLRPAVNLFEKALALPVPTVLPLQREFGLIELPSSMLLLGRQGARRCILPAAMRRKLKQGLCDASERKEVFHLWFHPSNFYADTNTQFELLEFTLQEAVGLRQRNAIDIFTMADYSAMRAA